MNTRTRVALFAANVLLLALGTQYAVLTLLAFFIDVISILRGDKRDIFSLLFFIMPFAVIFKIVPGMPSLFQALILAAVAVLFLRKKHLPISFVILLGLFVIYNLPDAVRGINTLYKLAVGFVLLYFFIEENGEEDTPCYIYSFSAGMLASSVLGKLTALFPGILTFVSPDFFYQLNGVRSDRYTGLYGDPNYYTVGIILSMALLLLLYARGRLGNIFFPLFVLLSYFGMGTGSKSFLLLYVLVCGILFFVACTQRKYWLIALCGVAAVGVVALTLLGRFSALTTIINRILSNEIGDFTTGRITIWIGYLNRLLQDPLRLIFGYGLNEPLSETVTHVAHSTYIDALYYLGLLGTLLLGLLIFFVLRRGVRRGKVAWYNLIAPALLVALYAFLSELYYGELPFHIMLAYVGFIYDRRPQEERAALSPPAFLPISALPAPQKRGFSPISPRPHEE